MDRVSPDNQPQFEHGNDLLENKAVKSNQFKATLTGIQSKPLSPENIDSYAEDALVGLINLTTSITDEYRIQNTSISPQSKELEDSAFAYFGLNNLEEILSYVASKDSEIKHISELIDRAENLGITIVPPQEQENPIQVGSGNFEKKSIISRTKTLLFILSNDFDVDLEDPEQFSLKTGVLSDNQMRGLSYFMINAPKLDRTILCCDEEGNVTYVFDDAVLKNHGISPEDLSRLTKSDINDLLQADPKMGKRVVYSSEFVPRMIGLIQDLQTDDSIPSNEGMGLYFYPKAPEGILASRTLARRLEVSQGTVFRAIEELGDLLGETQMFKFGSIITLGYTPEQQEIIRRHLENSGRFTGQAPEGILSVNGLAKKLGVSSQPVSRAIEELGDTLGETYIFRFDARRATGYTPKQQEMIMQHLGSKGTLAKQAPEGILSIFGIAKNLGLSHGLLSQVVKELGDALGETQVFKFGARRVAGYTLAQQEMVRQYLEDRGSFVGQVPEGIVSATGLAKKLGIAADTVERAIINIKDILGETQQHKFGAIIATSYTPAQQDTIRQYLEGRGNLSEHVPEGMLAAKRLAEKLGVSDGSVGKAIQELGDTLGETHIFRFGSAPTTGYTPAQQEIIRQYLESGGIFSVQAPEGILPIFGIAKNLGVTHGSVSKAVENLGDRLGRTQKFRFGSAPTTGYTPAQQEIIRQYLEDKGVLKSKPQ